MGKMSVIVHLLIISQATSSVWRNLKHLHINFQDELSALERNVIDLQYNFIVLGI